MNRIAKPAVILLSLLICVYVGLGHVLLGQTSNDKTYRALTVYTEVLQRIQNDYVEDPSFALVNAGALHGLLESLDPLSAYLSPNEFADYEKRRKADPKGKTGLAVSKKFGYVIVLSALPESPAAKAGLKPGDIFESIAGFTTREMSVAQAESLLAGEPGTSVKVGVIRRGRGDAQEVDLVRARIASSPVVSDRITEAVGYLRVPAFDAGRTAEIRSKLALLEQAGVRKLILDLRETATGEYAEAISTAQLFLNSGTVATLKGQTVPPVISSADASKVAWTHPMAVLTSPTTSGPAEIVAAAIGGNNRGPVVGTRTFGTASEQKVFPLEDGAALILTVAKYRTPAGVSIPDEGVVPTADVTQTFGDDSDEDAATRKPSSPDDPFVKKAIELLTRPWDPKAPTTTGAAAGGPGTSRAAKLRAFFRSIALTNIYATETV